ncbi:GerAB/ArcD/ProY family transporter [Cohnella terricola]|uniref:GerAB/ArcD/ProY family transporter n=1 Tax=Cohnella terricola TaxID=1289167 RepID=A0A559JQ68_9BACL|nr:endospore germination permease [Cohnella terricola]TVY01998.1 GerAB/ArcD/ProY family transporter [Cohnella terricola]
MNKQEQISSVQMTILFLFYLTGSSIVIIPAPLTNVAGNAAWISLLIALILGMLLLTGILYLYRRFPHQSLIEYSGSLLGRGWTVLLFIPFVCVMFWHVAGIVIEIGAFFKTTMLKESPTYAVNALLFVTIALTVRAGIEAIARMAPLLLILMFGFIFLVCVLVANLYHVEYLLPIVPSGIGPIFHAAYIAYGFPYAELVVFAIILPCIRPKDAPNVRKHLYFGLAANGATLLLSIICSIMVLGPLSGDLKYSLYQLARLIFIRETIERIESVIGFSLIVGFYFKASILLFILVRSVSHLLKLSNERLIVFPVAFVCLLLSLTTYTNEATLEEIVNTTWPLLNNVAYVCPMLLLIVAALLRRRGRKMNGDG